MSKQWTSTAGPRQTKAISKALRDVEWQGKKRIEVCDYGRMELVGLCDEIRPQALAILETIGDEYGWTITRDNHAAILARLTSALPMVEVPEIDKRTTAEEREERAKRNAENEATNAANAAKKASEKAVIVARLKEKYPWAKQDGSGHARASANIKRELAATFPGVAFSVRSESFSMGNSVDIAWTDGPASAEVEKVTSKYQYGDFDGMTDSYNYDHSAESEAVGEWLGRSKYVHCHRRESEGSRERIKGLLLAAGYNHDDNGTHHWQVDNVAYRLWAATTFPRGGSLVGVEHCDDFEGWKLTFDVPEVAAQDPTSTEAVSAEAHIEKHHHTKKGFDFWMVVLDRRVGTEEFNAIRDNCKAAGGWYSRQWGKTPGGFGFESEEAASAFLGTLTLQTA